MYKIRDVLAGFPCMDVLRELRRNTALHRSLWEKSQLFKLSPECTLSPTTGLLAHIWLAPGKMNSLVHTHSTQMHSTHIPQTQPIFTPMSLFENSLTSNIPPYNLFYFLLSLISLCFTMHDVVLGQATQASALERVRNSESWAPPPGLENKNFHFKRILRGFICTIKLKKHC